MTLKDIGVANEEIIAYMKLEIEGESTLKKRQRILNKKRDRGLDELNFQQACIEA